MKKFLPLLFMAIIATITSCSEDTEKKEEPKPEPKEFTVNFDSDGGSAVTAQIVTENDPAACPTPPTKDGFEFENWYHEASLTTIYDFKTPVTSDITLYAKWKAIDRTALLKHIDEGSKIEEGHYTPDSYKAMKDKLDAAKAIKENPAAAQEQIDKATGELKAAIDSLVTIETACQVTNNATPVTSVIGANGTMYDARIIFYNGTTELSTEDLGSIECSGGISDVVVSPIGATRVKIGFKLLPATNTDAINMMQYTVDYFTITGGTLLSITITDNTMLSTTKEDTKGVTMTLSEALAQF